MRRDENDDDDEHDSSETRGTTSTIALDWGEHDSWRFRGIYYRALYTKIHKLREIQNGTKSRINRRTLGARGPGNQWKHFGHISGCG
jgi:hypothetical protein